MLLRAFLCIGVPYDGVASDLAASQSKGIEAEREGPMTGDRYTPIETRLRGVLGSLGPGLSSLPVVELLGEPNALFS